jgi:hypothetical protein
MRANVGDTKRYNQQYYQEHKTTMLEQQKHYYETHREERSQYSKHYYYTEKYQKWRRQYNQRIDVQYRVFLSHARKRGIPCSLTFKRFSELKSMSCAFVDVDGEHCKGRMTIDRLANGEYTDDDCITLCLYHNSIKNATTPIITRKLCALYDERGL